ncbi:hypothetical protein RRG08_030952 [Elysia crispata]|uniref:Uncharacterized protein n=1 Tax=Elysia crispata TaxID=231223 RepID=A0AAE1ABG4_9GAST|nr:hypothetical protein RRG08_030952 [Elysia crispata]
MVDVSRRGRLFWSAASCPVPVRLWPVLISRKPRPPPPFPPFVLPSINFLPHLRPMSSIDSRAIRFHNPPSFPSGSCG